MTTVKGSACAARLNAESGTHAQTSRHSSSAHARMRFLLKNSILHLYARARANMPPPAPKPPPFAPKGHPLLRRALFRAARLSAGRKRRFQRGDARLLRAHRGDEEGHERKVANFQLRLDPFGDGLRPPAACRTSCRIRGWRRLPRKPPASFAARPARKAPALRRLPFFVPGGMRRRIVRAEPVFFVQPRRARTFLLRIFVQPARVAHITERAQRRDERKALFVVEIRQIGFVALVRTGSKGAVVIDVTVPAAAPAAWNLQPSPPRCTRSRPRS